MRPAAPALALTLLLAAPSGAAEELAAGAPAPTFSLRTLNPEVAGTGWLSLQKLVGPEAEDAGAKLVLLSFFASWCEPCKKELPLLVQLDRDYRELGLRVISVDIDTEEAGLEAARQLAAGVRHPVCSDRFNILARRYLGEKAPLPSVFLIRRDGTIARVDRGYAADAPAFLRAAVRAELGLPAEEGKATRNAARPARSAATQ
jgi:cytochrome c biogenesis protein CcmG, thiol:disulfide interchange protein DsbE